MVGVPASRAGPPDNGGSLFIYPSMRADTTDRLPFIGKSFLIPQMSGALNRRGHTEGIVAGTSYASHRASTSIDIGREGGWVDGSKRISDVSLDNYGDRLYFAYTREPTYGGLVPPSSIFCLTAENPSPTNFRSRDDSVVHASRDRVN